ncbi:hypothetical protein BOTCAL_0375g00030 [Botryotinia calthae]|uniref:Uncharacterized protein n=1 Tax=Botryotinia calthae TaxID=38488 RepID=A0A4Y8CRR1_9HELO|nr:hypothetical protein BOTCAL_0375g00030 [Botryotinia calthae]
MIDPRGLRVRFSGYRITRPIYDDSRPEDSWLDLHRVADSKGFSLHDLVSTNRSGNVTATSIYIAWDILMTTVSSILGIVMESPETMKSGKQRENGSVMENRATVVVGK